jgi:class 3 adenylate cyclase/tetratricopeptide (TPR) repeat protein
VAEADRRIITVLFADLSGFTSLTEQLDPERVRQFVARCLDPLCESVTRWGGFVDKFIGDCVMALFGAPVAYENEEERAIRAALDMHTSLHRWWQEAGAEFAESGGPLQLRIGINTGPVVTGVFSGGGARNYTAVGDTVNVASRLQTACEPGDILVGSTTFEPTRHIFEFGDEQTLRVRGKQAPVVARKVMGLRPERGRQRGFGGRRTPFIGRDAELGTLRAHWTGVQGGDVRYCLVHGPPGIGKSRLVLELLESERVPPEHVTFGRSYPYASSTPWETIAELLRNLHGELADREPAEVAQSLVERAGLSWSQEEQAALAVALGSPASGLPELVGYGSPEIRARVADAAVRALDIGAAEPRILVLEDLHWADQATLDLLASLPARLPRSPVFLVLVTRTPLPSETRLARLLESLPEQMQVPPLSRDESRAFIDAVLGEHGLPAPFVGRTLEHAEGNPLFLEEMLKSLADRGLIHSEDGVWQATGDLSGVEIPDTVESLLSTRIDGLSSSTKRVLQYASIVGRHFWSGVLADVLAQQPVDAELEELLQGEIVKSLPESVVDGEREYRFENLLLQEVAYQGLLRGLRAELHGGVARWLERQLPARSSESDELIAFHYERSTHRPLAAPYLERAAMRARAQGALPDALDLLERAYAASQEDDERFALLCITEDVVAAMGDSERWEEVVKELRKLADLRGDPESRAEAGYRYARALLARGKLAAAKREGARALELVREADGSGPLGALHSLLGRVAHLWGDYPTARSHYEAALPLHQAAGDRWAELELLDRLGLVEVDLDDFWRSLDYFDEVLQRAREHGHRMMELRVLAHRATALRWLGLYESAEASAREALELAGQLDTVSAAATGEMTLGFVLAAAGKSEEARTLLLSAAERAHEAGRPALEARTWLSLSELAEGEEAERWAAKARELSARTGLVHIDILARARQTELALERGDTDGADRLSMTALRRMRRHGSIQGPEEAVVWARARAVAALGRAEEAESLLEEARDIVREKAYRIPDPEARRHFLTVDPNPEILGVGAPVKPEKTPTAVDSV